MKAAKKGRKPLYGELTKAVSFKCPKSKIKELKAFVKQKLKTWEVKK